MDLTLNHPHYPLPVPHHRAFPPLLFATRSKHHQEPAEYPPIHPPLFLSFSTKKKQQEYISPISLHAYSLPSIHPSTKARGKKATERQLSFALRIPLSISTLRGHSDDFTVPSSSSSSSSIKERVCFAMIYSVIVIGIGKYYSLPSRVGHFAT